MKKRGCLWWVFIGWWWVPITLPFRMLAALIRRGKKAAKKMRPENKVELPEDQTQPEKPVPGVKTETHKVAGVSFRQDALKTLGTENPDFKKTKKQLQDEDLTEEWIHEYIFTPKKVELIPEPDNPYSENGNATKVVVDGQHIGYIKSGSSAHVGKLIKEDRIQQVECFIGGGKRKMLIWDDDEDRFTLETDEINFFARLSITTKP